MLIHIGSHTYPCMLPTHTLICVCLSHENAYLQMHIHMYAHTHAYTHTLTQIHSYTHHTHICTHSTFTCLNTSTNIFTPTDIHVHTPCCTHTSTYAYSYAQMYTHIFKCIWSQTHMFTHVLIHTPIHTHIYAFTHIHSHIHMLTHIDTLTQTITYTRTHIGTCLWLWGWIQVAIFMAKVVKELHSWSRQSEIWIKHQTIPRKLVVIFFTLSADCKQQHPNPHPLAHLLHFTVRHSVEFISGTKGCSAHLQTPQRTVGRLDGVISRPASRWSWGRQCPVSWRAAKSWPPGDVYQACHSGAWGLELETFWSQV